mgnify:CR=1 FL=1|jgi:hypothetical protein
MITEHTGDWFLPNSKIKLPGKLVIDDENHGIDLYIYSDKFLTGQEIHIKNDKELPRHFELIHGDCPTLITLFNCNWKSIDQINSSLFIVRYFVEFVFSYAHLKQNFKVKSINIEYPYLRTFFDGYQSVSTEEIKEQSVEYSNPVRINGNFSFRLVDSHQRDIKDFLDKNYSITHSKSIEFLFDEGLLFKDCFELMSLFSSLLCFTTEKKICYKINFLNFDKAQADEIEEGALYNSDIRSVTVENFSSRQSCDIKTKNIHQNMMLFSRWKNSEEQLNNIIIKWFNNKEFIPIYDFYLDATDWYRGKVVRITQVNFNNKFLNLCQALESYYDLNDFKFNANNEEFTKKRQQALNCIEDYELKLWTKKNLKFPSSPKLSDKLDQLINKFSFVFDKVKGLEEFLKTYSVESTEYRHKLSHGRIRKTSQGEDFRRLYDFSTILLCFCVLESLGMSERSILSIVKDHHEINQRLHYLVHT